MIFKEKDFGEVVTRMGLRAMLRLLPWASFSGVCFLLLSLLSQKSGDPLLPYHRAGSLALLIWPLAMEIAVLRSLRRRCLEKATLYAVLILA